MNTIDRLKQSTRSGLAFAGQHPAYIVKSRIKRVADWIAPMSFFLRHYGLDRYQGPLAEPGVRRPLFVAAVLLPLLVMATSIPGLLWSVRDPAARWLLVAILLYFLAVGAPLQGMSRYRIAIEPLLIVLAGGFAAGCGRPWLARKAATAALLPGFLMLGGLWWINWRELAAYLKLIW